MQFSALCYNLIGKYKTANYLNTGAWGRAAAEEAKKFCRVNIVDDQELYTSNREAHWNVEQRADFFHYIENETADGLEYNDFPFDKVPAH